MKNIPDKIIVHHSAFDQEADQLMKINKWHEDRDFPLSQRGYFVGYHYVINHEGQISQTRELDEVGAHARGFNFESIGVCLEGDFTSHKPSAAQTVALGKLLVMLVNRLRIDPSDIKPHRNYGQTSCFGSFLPDDWAENVYRTQANLMDYQQSSCEIPISKK